LDEIFIHLLGIYFIDFSKIEKTKTKFNLKSFNPLKSKKKKNLSFKVLSSGRRGIPIRKRNDSDFLRANLDSLIYFKTTFIILLKDSEFKLLILQKSSS